MPMQKLGEPKGGFPVPHKYIDVDRQTDTLSDVLQDKNIEGYWLHGSRL